MPTIRHMKAKVCLVGEEGVGKTSLIKRFAFDRFDDRYLKTVGTKVTKIRLDVPTTPPDTSVELNLVLFDIMGQKGFRDMVKDTFFLGARGILAVCDLTRPATLDALHDWVAVSTEATGSVPTYLLANKSDREPRSRRVRPDELQGFAEAHEAQLYLTSAKTGSQIEEAFGDLAIRIVDRAAGERRARSAEGLADSILTLLAERATPGMNKRQFSEAFKGIGFTELRDELVRLEGEMLIQLNWLGPGDFKAYLTEQGRVAVRARRAGGETETEEILL